MIHNSVLTFFLAVFPAFCLADSSAECGPQFFRNSALQAQRYENSSGDCVVSVLPLIFNDITYRSYLISSQGKLLVFNSLGEGPNSTHTGARVYYFFPRVSLPQLNPDSQSVYVQFSDQDSLSFDLNTGLLSGLTRGQLTVDPQIRPDNQGGVEILQFPGLILDAGFALGQDPTAKVDQKSVFIDAKGQRCLVKNTQLFSFTAKGDIRWTMTDPELVIFLGKYCPNIEAPF